MTTTTYVEGRLAAEGGFGPLERTINPELIDGGHPLSPFPVGVAVLFNDGTGKHVVACTMTGNVYAEADDPADLVPWFAGYLGALAAELAR